MNLMRYLAYRKSSSVEQRRAAADSNVRRSRPRSRPEQSATEACLGVTEVLAALYTRFLLCVGRAGVSGGWFPVVAQTPAEQRFRGGPY